MKKNREICYADLRNKLLDTPFKRHKFPLCRSFLSGIDINIIKKMYPDWMQEYNQFEQILVGTVYNIIWRYQNKSNLIIPVPKNIIKTTNLNELRIAKTFSNFIYTKLMNTLGLNASYERIYNQIKTPRSQFAFTNAYCQHTIYGVRTGFGKEILKKGSWAAQVEEECKQF